MRSITRLGLTLSFALPLLFSTTATTASPSRPLAPAARVTKLPWQAGGVRFVPNEVVVTWKASASRTAVRALAARMDARVVSRAAGLDVDVVRLSPGSSVAAAVRRLKRSPLVRFAEPNRIATPLATPITDDPLVDEQWALDNTGQLHELSNQGVGTGDTRMGTDGADVDAPEAWDAQTVHTPVVVAVLDTGVDVDHPDLQNRLVNGWDFFDGDNDPSPATGGGSLSKLENAHGTHVAGIVAAEQNNTIGVSGVCPDCSIMAIRIGSATDITLGHEVQGINYAINNHADVINLSIGSPVWSKTERNALKNAGNHGILVVAAAGNSSLDNDTAADFVDNTNTLIAWAPSFPASYTLSNVLSVAASNDRDQYGLISQCGSQGYHPWECAFTSWGHDSVDVAAPGVDIWSTVTAGIGLPPGGTHPDYDVWDGTSMASPMVAGIAGLVLAEHPGYSAVQVKNAIMHGVDHPANMYLWSLFGKPTHIGTGKHLGKFTRTTGRVNAFNALTAPTTNATPKTDGNIDGAKPIRLSKKGHVAWPADANDVYKKRLLKGKRYRVVLNGPKGSDMDLWVWNPHTAEIFQFTAGCFGFGGGCPALKAVSAGKTADEAVTFKAGKKGVYYFQVNGWYKGGGYALTIKRV